MRVLDTSCLPETAAETSFLASLYRSAEIYRFCTELNRDISMLHPDLLALLYHFGARTDGPILEFGPYIGGSTIAMARGLLDAKRSKRVITVEKGGSHEHPRCPSKDIVADLRSNLVRYGVADVVDVIVGQSRDAEVIQSVSALVGAERFGCLVIDSDGHVGADFGHYRPLLQSRAYLVVDDFFTTGANVKKAITQSELNALEANGEVVCLGVYGWGTWIGQVA